LRKREHGIDLGTTTFDTNHGEPCLNIRQLDLDFIGRDIVVSHRNEGKNAQAIYTGFPGSFFNYTILFNRSAWSDDLTPILYRHLKSNE